MVTSFLKAEEYTHKCQKLLKNRYIAIRDVHLKKLKLLKKMIKIVDTFLNSNL